MDYSDSTLLDTSTTLEHPSTNSISTTFPLRSTSVRSQDGPTARTRTVDEETSNALTTTRFTLRKKGNSISTSTATFASTSTSKSTSTSTSDTCTVPLGHMRRLSGIPKTLSFPNFHPQPQHQSDDSRPASAHSAIPPNTPPPLTPTLQPSLLVPNRSPSLKRKPPASHSSYGVDSSLGPPPSYSTQRTLSQDRVRTTTQNTKSAASGSGSATAAGVTDRVTPLNQVALKCTPNPGQSDQPASDHPTDLPLSGTFEPDFSSPETLDSHSPSATQTESDTTPPTSAGGINMTEADERVNTGLGLDGAQDDPKASSSDETQKSEDLFLNIAKTDASRPSSSRADKRRTRITLPFFSGSRPSTAAKSSPMTTQFESPHLAPRSERPLGKRSSLGQHVPGALTSSSYFDDNRSYVEKPTDLQSNVGSSVSQLRSRRHSNANIDTLRPPTRSRTSRLVSEGLYGDRFRVGENVATESTISTTAPSTVWDELDDLKSRIKKLELTGKLPPSSAAAMTSTERPRTATTAATTLSSSPKNNKPSATPLASTIEGIPLTVHPLLHEALSNAKAAVNQDIYQKLQSTAQDALQLSSMLSQEGYGSNGSPLSPQTERQLRRRTESMCRSLTELAIVMLSDNKAVSSPASRPGSREQHTSSVTTLRARGNSNDTPTERPPISSRVQSRLENRRTSLLMQQNTPTSTTSNEAPQSAASNSFRTPPTSVVSQPISSRLSRISTATASRSRRSQAHSFLDGAGGTDNEDDSPSITTRPVSRAMTELTPSQSQSTGPSSYRSLARDRAVFSREYTKQHPLPTQQTTTTVIDPASLAHRMPMPSNITTNATRIVSRRTFPTSEMQSPGGYESSPGTGYNATPTHIARPPFTISIERRHPSSPAYQSPQSQTQAHQHQQHRHQQYQHPQQQPHQVEPSHPSPSTLSQHTPSTDPSERRTSSTRRSLGFASRISNVSSRLKAARAERLASATYMPNSPIGANMGVVRSEKKETEDFEHKNGGLPPSVSALPGEEGRGAPVSVSAGGGGGGAAGAVGS